MERADLQDWLERYERSWRTPGTAHLAGLFAADATYSMGPYEEVHRGREAIERLWEAERQGPDERFEMRSEIVAVEGEVGVVRIAVDYADPPRREYRDLWIVMLDETGACFHFEEWPHWPGGPGDDAG